MKKGFKFYSIVWAILFILFNVIVFVVPNENDEYTKFGGAFWSGYIFISLAFIGQLICAFFALQAENKNKLFLNIPIISISYTGFILSVIAGIICMVIPNLPNWIGIIICLAILAFTAISVIKATTAIELVQSVDKKIKEQTLFIKSLTVDANVLQSRATSNEAKKATKNVYEAIRYSDPMSNSLLKRIEERIQEEFDVLSDAVTINDIETITSSSNEILNLLDERNQKCKMLK